MTQNKILFQVHVFDNEAKHEIAIGPAMDSPEPLYDFAEQTNLAILKGRIHGWRDAHVVQFTKDVQ